MQKYPCIYAYAPYRHTQSESTVFTPVSGGREEGRKQALGFLISRLIRGAHHWVSASAWPDIGCVQLPGCTSPRCPGYVQKKPRVWSALQDGPSLLGPAVCVASGLGIMPSTWILAGSFPPILPPKKTPLDSGSVTSQVRKVDG